MVQGQKCATSSLLQISVSAKVGSEFITGNVIYAGLITPSELVEVSQSTIERKPVFKAEMRDFIRLVSPSRPCMCR